jgi:hypothetical protein
VDETRKHKTTNTGRAEDGKENSAREKTEDRKLIGCMIGNSGEYKEALSRK